MTLQEMQEYAKISLGITRPFDSINNGDDFSRLIAKHRIDLSFSDYGVNASIHEAFPRRNALFFCSIDKVNNDYGLAARISATGVAALVARQSLNSNGEVMLLSFYPGE